MKKNISCREEKYFFHENNSLKVQTNTSNDPCAWLWNIPIVNVMGTK